MDQLTLSLGPIFVAGFAVQQFLELLTALLNLDGNASFEKYKKVILGITSLGAGFLLVWQIPELKVLHAVNIKSVSNWLDIAITAFVLSAGTEGVNSILKFFKYSKEDKKATAASKDPAGGAAGLAAGLAAGVPTVAAMQRMNMK